MRRARPALWPSPRGLWALFVLCVLLAVASVAAWAAALLLIAGGLFAAFLAIDLRLGPRAGELEMQREPLEHATIGKPVMITYEVVNRCGAALRIGFTEAPVEGLSFSEDVTVLAVPGRSRATGRREALPCERGLVRLRSLHLRVENQVGLFRRRFAEEAPMEVRVYPDLGGALGYGTLARRSTLLETGLRRLRLRGAGNEFESLREYEAGDAFRSINWKASARRGRLMVTQYDVERSQTMIVALDTGRLMASRLGVQRKFDYALTAALSAARVAQIAGDNVGFIAFAARILVHVAPGRGVAHHGVVVRASYDLQPRMEEPDYEALAADLERWYPKRSLIVVFTDLFDPAASTAVLSSLALLAPRHLVLCVLMNDAAIESALATESRELRGAYRAATAMMLEGERREAIAVLRSRGVLVVDAPARRLTIALLDAYLDVKARGLL